MKSNVYICKTTWEIFVSILLASDVYYSKNIKSVFVIEVAEENINYIPRLSDFCFILKVVSVKFSSNKYIKALCFLYRVKYFLPKVLGEYLKNDVRVNLFIDQGVFGQFFLKNHKDVYLYEHGNGNYCVGPYPNYKLIKKILGITEGYGRHSRVKRVYLQHPEKAPQDIRNKVIGFSIKHLYCKLCSREQQALLSFFGVKDINKSNDIIILTQPISEDGFYSEKEKIEIYKEIINSRFSHDKSRVVIKPHPRDKTDYSKYIPDVMLLPRNFPMEILNFTDVRFVKAITICSSAVYNFGYDISVDYIGTLKYPKLIKA
ncbi:hypothetical protein K4J79_004823, partial [Escherichia coli]|nr:hypothetical protein [Escherichia coli]